MKAKQMVQNESARNIKVLEKKRKDALLALFGRSNKSDFLKDNQMTTSSVQAAANLSDRPSTSRQGDTLIVSNNSERMPAPSQDAEQVAAVIAKARNAVTSEEHDAHEEVLRSPDEINYNPAEKVQ
jgi:hypothetical protein